MRAAPFSPLLEGYFHDPLMKISTIHLLSGLRQIMYSSLSLHFVISDNFIEKFKFIIVCTFIFVNPVFLIFFNPAAFSCAPVPLCHSTINRTANRYTER